jgi:hypothetical protein
MIYFSSIGSKWVNLINLKIIDFSRWFFKIDYQNSFFFVKMIFKKLKGKINKFIKKKLHC